MWTGDAGDNQWTSANNWSGHAVPGPTDDVTIPGGFPTIIYSSESGLTIDSLSAASPLEFDTGSLSISSSMPIDSTISSDLSFKGGTLAVSGADSSLLISGTVIDASGTLTAQDGATISAPGLKDDVGAGMSLSAIGPGSELDISAITSWNGSGTTMAATAGGKVDLASAQTIQGVTFVVDGTGSIPLDQFTAITDGGIDVVGGSYSLPNLTDVGGSSILATNGGSLALPGVSAVSAPFTDFSAQGGTLDISKISSFNSYLDLIAETQGGTIDLDPALTSISGVQFTVDGSGNPLDQFTAITGGAIVVEGGTYTLTNLTNVNSSTLSAALGASLTLPAVKAYDPGSYYVSFLATSTNKPDGQLALPPQPHQSPAFQQWRDHQFPRDARW